MKYRTIVADPPWPLSYSGVGSRSYSKTWGRKTPGRYYSTRPPGLGYDTMSVDEIAALDVLRVADADCRLFLWIPDQFLIVGDGERVCSAWGFKPGRLLVWRKPGYGLGAFPRPQHEAILVAKRGSPALLRRDVGSVQDWKQVYAPQGPSGVPAKVNSAKPDGFLDLVESVSPGPYLELFARRQRLGWDTWGNEALEHVEIA